MLIWLIHKCRVGLEFKQKKILCPFPGGEPGFFIAGGAMPSTDFKSEQQKRGLWLGNTVMKTAENT